MQAEIYHDLHDSGLLQYAESWGVMSDVNQLLKGSPILGGSRSHFDLTLPTANETPRLQPLHASMVPEHELHDDMDIDAVKNEPLHVHPDHGQSIPGHPAMQADHSVPVKHEVGHDQGFAAQAPGIDTETAAINEACEEAVAKAGEVVMRAKQVLNKVVSRHVRLKPMTSVTQQSSMDQHGTGSEGEAAGNTRDTEADNAPGQSLTTARTSGRATRASSSQQPARDAQDVQQKGAAHRQTSNVTGIVAPPPPLPAAGGIAAASNSKGLRQFALKVCEKVRERGRTTYNDVADDLVVELSKACDVEGRDVPDEKTIRRRVYDAINVLMAMGIMEREKKDIIWKGLNMKELELDQASKQLQQQQHQPHDTQRRQLSPPPSPVEVERTLQCLAEKRLQGISEVDRKINFLQDLIEQHGALKQLAGRNLHHPPTGSTQIQLPFLLLQARPDATVEVKISEDMQDAQFFVYDSAVVIHDDSLLVRHLAASMAPTVATGSMQQHDSSLMAQQQAGPVQPQLWYPEPQEPVDLVYTIDDEEIEREKAHKLTRRMFQFGFLFLPLLWLMNVWLFWPDMRAGVDPVITKYTKRSAVSLAIATALYLPWFIFYLAAGSKALSTETYNNLDVSRFPLKDYLAI